VLHEHLARAHADHEHVLAREVVVETWARARARDADGFQLGVLSKVREWVL